MDSDDYNCVNWTEQTIHANSSSYEFDYSLFSDVYKTVAGSCIFFLVFPFVLFHFKFFPVRATSAVLLGALLMVVFNVVTQEDTYAVIGARNNLMTIFLLLGMMLIGEYVERERLVGAVLRRLLRQDLGFPGFLLRVAGMAFVLSLLFTSDGSCLMLTPILLKCWKEHERPRGELETLLLAVMTSANIGGAATYFGNLSLALIAAKTKLAPYRRSLVDLRTCLKYLLPPAFVCFWINYALLVLHYQIKSWKSNGCRDCERRRAEHEPFGQASGGSDGASGRASGNGFLKRVGVGGGGGQEELYYDSYAFREERLAHPPTLETILEDEVLELPESSAWILELGSDDAGGDDIEEAESGDVDAPSSAGRLRPCIASEDLTALDIDLAPPSEDVNSSPVNSSSPAAAAGGSLSRLSSERPIPTISPHPLLTVYGPQCGISTADFFGVRLQSYDQESSCASKVLQVALVVVLVVVVVLLLVSSHSLVEFDIGLVPFCGALLMIAVDTAVNRRSASAIVNRIDWSLVVTFFAVFVWMHGFNETGVPRWVWHKLGFAARSPSLTQATGVAVLALTVVVTANTFGPVPVTIMVLDQLEPCADQLRLVLYLAWIATVSGNVTLLSSVANTIVTHKSVQSLNYQVTFCGYLRYGLPSSILMLVVGLIVISLLLLIH